MSQPTILCMSSYYKGVDFLREAKAQGARVLMLTIEELKDEDWAQGEIDDFRYMHDLLDRRNVLNAVGWLARHERIDRVIPLDEFDLEMAAIIREHLWLPGPGTTPTLSVRDKLRMRLLARDAGIAVPEFTSLVNDDDVKAWAGRVPTPWILKPRGDAATKGIRRIDSAAELWPHLEALGDRRSHHLLERFVPGDVFHVDGIVADGEIAFAEAHAYAQPPFDVTRGGGLFMSRTVERGSDLHGELIGMTGQLVRALDIDRTAIHAEFIRSHDGGRVHFLEIAARVGGAHIADMVEAATGVNLWREWAKVEIADARGAKYDAPKPRADYAGVLISLARQEWPDDSSFDAPEIVWRMKKSHHIGMVVRSDSLARVAELQNEYGARIARDFSATIPET